MWRRGDFRSDDLSLSGQLGNCHRHVFLQVEVLESFDIRRPRIDHYKLRFRYSFLIF